jgi:branched-subunit amino acid permease
MKKKIGKMMTTVELSVIIATLAIAASISINAYNFSKESQYLKNKYKQKGYVAGYEEGYSQGFYDGIEFIDDIIPPKHGRKKK